MARLGDGVGDMEDLQQATRERLPRDSRHQQRQGPASPSVMVVKPRVALPVVVLKPRVYVPSQRAGTKKRAAVTELSPVSSASESSEENGDVWAIAVEAEDEGQEGKEYLCKYGGEEHSVDTERNVCSTCRSTRILRVCRVCDDSLAFKLPKQSLWKKHLATEKHVRNVALAAERAARLREESQLVPCGIVEEDEAAVGPLTTRNWDHGEEEEAVADADAESDEEAIAAAKKREKKQKKEAAIAAAAEKREKKQREEAAIAAAAEKREKRQREEAAIAAAEKKQREEAAIAAAAEADRWKEQNQGDDGGVAIAAAGVTSGTSAKGSRKRLVQERLEEARKVAAAASAAKSAAVEHDRERENRRLQIERREQEAAAAGRAAAALDKKEKKQATKAAAVAIEEKAANEMASAKSPRGKGNGDETAAAGVGSSKSRPNRQNAATSRKDGTKKRARVESEAEAEAVDFSKEAICECCHLQQCKKQQLCGGGRPADWPANKGWLDGVLMMRGLQFVRVEVESTPAAVRERLELFEHPATGLGVRVRSGMWLEKDEFLGCYGGLLMLNWAHQGKCDFVFGTRGERARLPCFVVLFSFARSACGQQTRGRRAGRGRVWQLDSLLCVSAERGQAQRQAVRLGRGADWRGPELCSGGLLCHAPHRGARGAAL